MHTRCPHCNDQIEILGQDSLAHITCSSCGSNFSLLPDETISFHQTKLKQLGRFELIELLGVGAHGAVWKARDPTLDRKVAVKVPRKEQLTAIEAEQFLREARAAAQLRHPKIVTVHEIGSEDGQPYIVTDYVQAVSMADWLTGHRLTVRETADLCVQIAEALQHAHETGVIHRDLKPSNILIDGEGKPYVMDFGIAKRESGEVTMTVEGKILGTPAYMSPEQARGEGHFADRRSDIYSMGVILFQLLTGELPFRGNRHMLIHQVIHDEPPNPRKLNNKIPQPLASICVKCLQKKCADRYDTADDFAKDLQRWLGGQSVHARNISDAERFWKLCWRSTGLFLQSPRARMLIFLFLIPCFIIQIVALIAGQTALQGWQWQHLPFHSVIETVGALVALLLAVMLTAVNKSGGGKSSFVWVSGAFVGMGILQGFHAMSEPGKIWIWLEGHSIMDPENWTTS